MTTGIVIFNQPEWARMFPVLAPSIPDASSYFGMAELYLTNGVCSPVRSVEKRKKLLYLLTAHIAVLVAGVNCQTPSPTMVGRINNAAEGSVSVQTENEYPPGTAQWYQQTQYGAMYYAATAIYRMARYVPAPQPVFDPYPGAYGGWNGYGQPPGGSA